MTASRNIRVTHGAEGDAVRRVQEIVGDTPTGTFGARTLVRLRAWQRRHGLVPDGVYGPHSWDVAVREAEQDGSLKDIWPRVRVERTKLHGVQKYVDNGTSYDRVYLRYEASEAFRAVLSEITAKGGVLTTSGSRRGINARVTEHRSKTSLHMLYRAVDLGVYTGCVSPKDDPLIITQEPGVRYRVWARADGAPKVELLPVTLRIPPEHRVPVIVRAVDVTELLGQHGFKGIRARRRSWPDPTSVYGGSDWWHFQYERGLEQGLTAYGDELLKCWGIDELRASPVWKYRHRAWGRGWR